MYKKIKNSIILVLVLTFFVSSFYYVDAKEINTETKLKETKETINELIEAKDENSPFDTSLRIKTFKRVVDLSISEAKDLKINLIATEELNEDLIKWREEMIAKLNEIIEYYEEKLKNTEDQEGSLDLEEIKELATNFKNWREENYIPVQEKIQNLLLIKKEQRALEISNRRLEKISKDIKTLEKARIKNTEELNVMLENANQFIKKAEENNKTALKILIERYVPKEIEIESTETETATSTEKNSTSTQDSEEQITTSTIDNSSSTKPSITTSTKITTTTEERTETTTSTEDKASSTIEKASSTETNLTTSTLVTTSSIQNSTTTEPETAVNDPYSNVSIRDLISSSWNNIRSAYEIFIEMSDFVRKSLE